MRHNTNKRWIHSLLAVALCTNLYSAEDLKIWKDIVRFRPSVEIQKAMHSKGAGWSVHRIEDAVEEVNLDYYSVEIKKMPTVAGLQMSAEDLLKHVRLNFSSFMDNNSAEFEPFAASDKQIWEGNNPRGALLLIRIYLAKNGVCSIPTLNNWACPAGVTALDYGCVVVSEASSSRFRFSTVKGGSGWTAINDRTRPGAHPVSGNREFGFSKTGSGSYVFYSIGADRATRSMDAFWGISSLKDEGFLAGETLWRSYLTKLAELVNKNGGNAVIRTPRSTRHDWQKIKAQFLVEPIEVPWVNILLQEN